MCFVVVAVHELVLFHEYIPHIIYFFYYLPKFLKIILENTQCLHSSSKSGFSGELFGNNCLSFFLFLDLAMDTVNNHDNTLMLRKIRGECSNKPTVVSVFTL